MTFRGVHHVGFAVTDLDEAVETYRRLFGATLEHRDLTVVDLDQITQRLDSHQVRVREFHRVEQLLSLRSEHVRDTGQHTFLGHHRMHLCLEPTAQLHQPRAVADELA